MPEEWHTLIPQGKDKLCIWDPPILHSMHLFIWLVLICVLYSKTLIISIVFSWILCIVLVNYQTCKCCGNPQICSQSVRSIGGPQTPKAWLMSEVRSGLWRTSPFTCGVCSNFGWLEPELNYSTPGGVRICIKYLDSNWNMWELNKGLVLLLLLIIIIIIVNVIPGWLNYWNLVMLK